MQQLSPGLIEYQKLIRELEQLTIKKNAGYSGQNQDAWSNFRQCESFGVSAASGILTRMSDKWERLKNIWSNSDNEQVGEKVEDTLLDLANYAIILVCILREGKQE
jgi:hypothetical protein